MSCLLGNDRARSPTESGRDGPWLRASARGRVEGALVPRVQSQLAIAPISKDRDRQSCLAVMQGRQGELVSHWESSRTRGGLAKDRGAMPQAEATS